MKMKLCLALLGATLALPAVAETANTVDWYVAHCRRTQG